MVAFKLFLITVIYLAQFWHCDCSAVKAFQDENSFKTDVTSTEYSLVDFYASWCPHCNTLAPKYEEAAALIENGSLRDKVSLHKVECNTVGRQFCDQNKIESYPTIKTYHQGKDWDVYYGERTADAMVKYLQAVVETGRPQFAGKQLKPHVDVCMAKDFKKYVSHKS